MRREKMIELRQKRSQQQVAKDLGIPRATLSMIEQGRRMPRPALAKRIADYYGVTVDHLFYAN